MNVHELKKRGMDFVLYIKAIEKDDPEDTVALMITNGFGIEVMWVTKGGGLHFNSKFKPGEQAMAFGLAMAMMDNRRVLYASASDPSEIIPKKETPA